MCYDALDTRASTTPIEKTAIQDDNEVRGGK
jgi:hypothetical protein